MSLWKCSKHRTHMELEISKSYFFHTFHLIPSKLWGHCLPWRNTGYYFSWQSASFTKLMALGTSSGSQLEKPKCGLSRKWLIVERYGQRVGIRDPTVHVCRVLSMADSLSLIWDHSVHFAKFPSLQFSTRTQFSSIFIQTLYKVS